MLRGDGSPGDAITFISDRDTPNPYHTYYVIPAPNNFDWATVALAEAPLNTWTSHELFVAGPDGDRGWMRRLTYDVHGASLGWVARGPNWSPDGHRIAFTQQRAPEFNYNSASPPPRRVMLLTFHCPGDLVASGSAPQRVSAARLALRLRYRARHLRSGPRCAVGDVRAEVKGRDSGSVSSVTFSVGGRRLARVTSSPFRALLARKRIGSGSATVRARVLLNGRRRVTLSRTLRICPR